MDFKVSVYDVILTYYENIDLGSASVNISIVSQYHIIYTDLKVHNCIILPELWPPVEFVWATVYLQF